MLLNLSVSCSCFTPSVHLLTESSVNVNHTQEFPTVNCCPLYILLLNINQCLIYVGLGLNCAMVLLKIFIGNHADGWTVFTFTFTCASWNLPFQTFLSSPQMTPLSYSETKQLNLLVFFFPLVCVLLPWSEMFKNSVTMLSDLSWQLFWRRHSGLKRALLPPFVVWIARTQLMTAAGHSFLLLSLAPNILALPALHKQHLEL